MVVLIFKKTTRGKRIFFFKEILHYARQNIKTRWKTHFKLKIHPLGKRHYVVQKRQ